MKNDLINAVSMLGVKILSCSSEAETSRGIALHERLLGMSEIFARHDRALRKFVSVLSV